MHRAVRAEACWPNTTKLASGASSRKKLFRSRVAGGYDMPAVAALNVRRRLERRGRSLRNSASASQQYPQRRCDTSKSLAKDDRANERRARRIRAAGAVSYRAGNVHQPGRAGSCAATSAIAADNEYVAVGQRVYRRK